MRELEVSVGWKMLLNVFTKEILVCYAFVNVRINGAFKCAGTVKIRGFDTFLRCKLRGGGYRVN